MYTVPGVALFKFTRYFASFLLVMVNCQYDHFAVLCELLPSAIPSLALNLLVTSHGYFNQSLLIKLKSALKNNAFAPIIEMSTSFFNLNNDPYLFQQLYYSAFPGHSFYELLRDLESIEQRVAKLVSKIRKERGWMTDYNVQHNFSSPLRVDELMGDDRYLHHSVTDLIRSFK